jgi:hypothetical protein
MSEVVLTAWAQAYSNGDFVCIVTHSGYRISIFDPSGKEHRFPSDVGELELGLAVLDALAHSRFVRPQEDAELDAELFDYRKSAERYSVWVKSLMAAYGYKTKRALFEKMKCCLIESCGGVITIRPTNHETLEGWSGDGINSEDEVTIPCTSPPAELGVALRMAFSRCIGRV